MLPAMKKNLTKILEYLISIVLAAIFMVYAFRGVDLNALWNMMIQIHWIWIVILFVGTVLSHLVRAWRWRYLLLPVKEKVSLRNSFSAVMVGYMVNNVLPRVGEFVRPYMLGMSENISRTAAFGTVVIERIVDLITFTFIVLVVLSFSSGSFEGFFPYFEGLQPLFLVGAVVVLIVFVLMFLKANLLFGLVRRLARFLPEKIQEKIDTLSDKFSSGLTIARHPGIFLRIGISSVIIWGSYVVLMYIPFFAFPGIAEHHLGFRAATMLTVISGIAFALPTPSGFGTYHSFTTIALTQVYGIDVVTALGFSLLTHEMGFIATTIVGLYYFVKDRRNVIAAVKK
jgi:uncharacterized protein (TIRG00374 family)